MTRLFVGLNILIFFFSWFSYGISPEGLIQAGGKARSLIFGGEYLRLFTPVFLHANIFHLFSNMMALWSLGRLIEYNFSWRIFVLIFLLTGISGNIASVFFYKSDIVSVGASGAICGLLGFITYLKFFGKNEFKEILSPVKSLSLLLVLFLNFIIFPYFLPFLDNAAHAGGFLGGLLIAIFYGRSLNFSLPVRSLNKKLKSINDLDKMFPISRKLR